MEASLQMLIIVLVVVMLAEVTYLVAKFPRQSLGRGKGRAILVDTSVLIDGRIIAVAKSGFVTDTLVIPRSVIGELQFLADNADHEKRARARHGLDVVAELQAMPHMTVEILQDGSRASEGVDERLLSLAKKYQAAVCTIDYNLNKVALVEGITVLNVNELAQSLRMAYLPGERRLLELVQKGQDPHQAVGYLSDGTMVVVEHANKSIGQTVEVEFIRSLQTAAGKMMFARRVDQEQPVRPKNPTTKNSQHPRQPANERGVAIIPTESRPTKVYHSDKQEQRTSEKKKPLPQRQPQKQPTKAANAHFRKPRPQDKEAVLIDLADKQ